MVSKSSIFNLALGALLLQRQITNTDTDTTNENKVLNTHWDIAFQSALEDMDLNATSTQASLELLAEDPVHGWKYAYKYPSKCAFFRRIQSHLVVDNRHSHHPKRVAIFNGQKVIFADKANAIAEFIPTDFPITALSATAAMTIAFRLAVLSAPLITGKGAAKLTEELMKKYAISKAEAQAQDERESFSFETEATMSEFVETRLS